MHLSTLQKVALIFLSLLYAVICGQQKERSNNVERGRGRACISRFNSTARDATISYEKCILHIMLLLLPSRDIAALLALPRLMLTGDTNYTGATYEMPPYQNDSVIGDLRKHNIFVIK